MIRVTVLYPKSADSQFDWDYYVNKHTPLVQDRLTPLGMHRIEIDQGVAGLAPGQPATYEAIAYLVFDSVEDLQKGMGAHGPEILGDIVNYTNIQPIVQINQIAFG